MANQPQRESSKAYKPIPTDFYDQLEVAASHKERCEIVYLDDNNKQAFIISPIHDLYTEQGVEYARLDNNQTIRLDRIVSVNGKTAANAGTDTIDTDIVNENRLPVDPNLGAQNAPSANANTSRSATHDQVAGLESTPAPGTIGRGDNYRNEDTGLREPREQYESYESDIERIETARGSVHQPENVRQDRDLEDRVRPQAVTPDEVPQLQEVPADVQSPHKDLGHRFATSVEPFVIAENEYYHLMADRLRNRLYLTAKQWWPDLRTIADLGDYLTTISRYMMAPFTLLNDLTRLRPDENGTLVAPDVPGKDALLSAGLVQVADLVPVECETLVHGIHSFSVNSLRLRYFKDRALAEAWLTGDDQLSTDMRNDRG